MWQEDHVESAAQIPEQQHAALRVAPSVAALHMPLLRRAVVARFWEMFVFYFIGFV